jgi:hypothetical protein
VALILPVSAIDVSAQEAKFEIKASGESPTS